MIDFASASIIFTIYGLPNTVITHEDLSLGSGAYYWWVQSFNPSGHADAEVGPETQVIT